MNIKINRKYTRSVNLERDMADKDGVAGYIPTARGMSVFQRFSTTVSLDSVPRSWALVGPYGTGKSSFGLFLSAITGNSQDPETVAARKSVRSFNKKLADDFGKRVRGTNGFLKVILTGRPESFLEAFAKALKEGVERFWKKKPAFYKKILSWGKRPSITEVLEVVKEIQAHLADKFSKPVGILVVVDELGKFLEYEARHDAADGIFLLQELAEHAYKGSSANIYLFTLSHQSFEQYASSLSKVQREEWAKIQGRFENIPFLEPIEQTLSIVAKAIEVEEPLNPSLQKVISVAVDELVELRALPHGLSKKKAQALFEQCYPLHPFTALILPLLCQRVAQNERTLFSYIGSEEPFGFKDCLARMVGDNGFVYPWAIYDYFIANQSSNILDHFTYRRWAEVVNALERLGDVENGEEVLLKTVGITNIIGARGGLKASHELLKQAAGLSYENFKKSLAKLLEKSLIQYRKYNDEYRVWQGSDFDLEEALKDELEQIQGTDFIHDLNSREILPPAIASRHSIETGTYRSYSSVFATEKSYKAVCKSNRPRIIYHFYRLGEDVQKVVDQFSATYDVVALSQRHDELVDAISQVVALERVQDSYSELRSDPVALREYKDRLLAAREQEESLLSSLLQLPESLDWAWQGERFNVENKRDLNVRLSVFLDEIYSDAPKIKNELINRDKPSTQAITGRNKLIKLMLESPEKEGLGIKKYPAEKAIYKAVLMASGLHGENGDGWEFMIPEEGHHYNMRPIWNKIDEFLDSTQLKPRPFTDLDAELQKPPFGVKAGVLPILYAAAYAYHKHELALYEDGKYIPVLPPERYMVFLKRMDLFSVQLFRVEGAKATLLDMYRDLFQANENNDGLVSIAKPLAGFFNELPDYSKKTKSVSPLSQSVRAAFYSASSPQKLFFDELPKACGFSSVSNSRDELDRYLVVLRGALKELSEVFNGLTKSLIIDLSKAFKVEFQNVRELRSHLQSRAEVVEQYLPASGELTTFVKHLRAARGSDSQWVRKVFSFLARRRCEMWGDGELAKARNALKSQVNSVLDLEKIYLSKKGKPALSTEEPVLLRVVQGDSFKDDVVHIESHEKEDVGRIHQQLQDVLGECDSDRLKLAALAQVLNDLIKSNHGERA